VLERKKVVLAAKHTSTFSTTCNLSDPYHVKTKEVANLERELYQVA
jgi:hypothetical protein